MEGAGFVGCTCAGCAEDRVGLRKSSPTPSFSSIERRIDLVELRFRVLQEDVILDSSRFGSEREWWGEGHGRGH